MKKEVVSKAAPKNFDELGASGLLRTGARGLVIEEFLPALSGIRAIRAFREMRENDPIVGAMMFAIEMLIRGVEWRVDGDDEKSVEFVDSCLIDMSHTWNDFVAEALSMLTYGWSWHEVVYKRRLGPGDDPTKNSRFNDGKIGWRKMPIRSQDSLTEWVFDDDGGVQAMVQTAPPMYNRVEIPISRSLLFRTGLHKNNPEGRSILRSAYRPWFFKKRIEEIEGIGVERDLAGLPVIYRTADIAVKYDDELKRILRNVRRDEQEGLLLPLAYDENGNKLLEFSLLSAPGQRQLDTGAIVDRYNKSIAMTCLADFILLGQQSVGSFALASSKTALFSTAIGAIMQSIAEVMNRYAIPRLLAINGIASKKEPPKLVPGDIETPDLQIIGAFITALAQAGAPLFPDDELEDHLRKIAGFPPKPEVKEGEIGPQPTGLVRSTNTVSNPNASAEPTPEQAAAAAAAGKKPPVAAPQTPTKEPPSTGDTVVPPKGKLPVKPGAPAAAKPAAPKGGKPTDLGEGTPAQAAEKPAANQKVKPKTGKK